MLVKLGTRHLLRRSKSAIVLVKWDNWDVPGGSPIWPTLWHFATLGDIPVVPFYKHCCTFLRPRKGCRGTQFDQLYGTFATPGNIPVVPLYQHYGTFATPEGVLGNQFDQHSRTFATTEKNSGGPI